jgi:CRP/FNR family transcriptional regulator, cyclic AMP receptor protein
MASRVEQRWRRSICQAAVGVAHSISSELMEDSSLLNAPARLAKRLLSLASLHGRKTPAGWQLKISQEDLAQFLGLSRQIVNKHLQTWKRSGWLTLGRGSVVLTDERALRKLTLRD